MPAEGLEGAAGGLYHLSKLAHEGYQRMCNMPLFRLHWLKLVSVQQSSVRLPCNFGLATAAILVSSE
jgi:hypothetical protein